MPGSNRPLIGREAVLVKNAATVLHKAATKNWDHTPLRDTADMRGQWFEVRLADGRIARVTVVLDRIEPTDG